MVKSYVFYLFIFITIVCIVFTALRIKETFAQLLTNNYNNSLCLDYLRNDNKAFFDKNIAGSSTRMDVAQDMFKATSKSYGDIKRMESDISGCVLPLDRLSDYKMTECQLNGQTYTTLAGDSYSPQGCYLPLNDDFGRFLDNAYNSKYKDYISRMSDLKLLDEKTTVDYEASSLTMADAQAQKLAADNALSESSALLQSTKQTVADATALLQSEQKENSEVTKENNNNTKTLMDLAGNLIIRIVDTNAMQLLQKKVMYNGKERYFTMIYKYTSTRGLDPYDYWKGRIYQDENVEEMYKNGPRFVSDATKTYRNSKLFDDVFKTPSNYLILIEVYKPNTTTPIATYGFKKYPNDDSESWFARGKIESDLTSNKQLPFWSNEFFSLKGDDRPSVKRRFFINHKYNGCGNDPAFLCIPTAQPCTWDARLKNRIITSLDGPLNFGGNTFAGIPGKTESQMLADHVGNIMVVYAVREANDPYESLSIPTIKEEFTAARPMPVVSSVVTPSSSTTVGQWKCLTGLSSPLRINNNNDQNVECMSTNARDCMWQGPCESLRTKPPPNLDPLTCGVMHTAKWGSSGYDTVGHWCNTGRRNL